MTEAGDVMEHGSKQGDSLGDGGKHGDRGEGGKHGDRGEGGKHGDREVTHGSSWRTRERKPPPPPPPRIAAVMR